MHCNPKKLDKCCTFLQVCMFATLYIDYSNSSILSECKLTDYFIIYSSKDTKPAKYSKLDYFS